MEQPTQRGQEIYADSGGFYVIDDDWSIACTCLYDCPDTCKGQCGCEACGAVWNDFLSHQGG